MEKYHKIKRIGDLENKDIFADRNDIITVQEKMDGANMRIFITQEGKLIFGSRNLEIDETVEDHEKRNSNFLRAINYIKEKVKDKDLTEYAGLTLYGENMVKHTMQYDWDNIPPFLGFDIKDREGKYMHPAPVEDIYTELGLEMVPHIEMMKAGYITIFDEDTVPVSKYAPKSNPKQQAEGVVYKNYDKQIFAKYVRDAFKEANSATFGGSPKYNKQGDTDNSEFIFKYCTNARIEKLIFKAVDEGADLDMKLMGRLIKETYLDIIEEEWREILTSNWKLDFKNIRRSIAPRVRAVLGQVMVNTNLK